MIAGVHFHPDKLILEPTHHIQYRVIIDSELVIVTLMPERATDMIFCCRIVVKKESVTIRDLARAIEKIVASFPEVI